MKAVWIRGLMILLFAVGFSVGCSSEAPPKENPSIAEKEETKKTLPDENRDPTPPELLNRTVTAMEESNGWTYRLESGEKLTVKSRGAVHTSSADYRATIRVVNRPYSLFSEGTITRKGREKLEKIYVADDTVYVKVGDKGWEKGKLSDPDMEAKIEDPMRGTAALQTWISENPRGVSLTKEGDHMVVRIRSTSQKIGKNSHVPFVQAARRELDSTLKQLQNLGFHIDPASLTLDRYEEKMRIDPATFRLKEKIVQFTVSFSSNKGTFTFRQQQAWHTSGEFSETIQLPDEVKLSAREH